MSLKTIETFLVDSVKALLGNKVREVKTLPGDWDDDLLRTFASNLPAVYTAFIGGPKAQPNGMNEAQIDASFAVYVATGHPVEEARRYGNAQAIGAYDLLDLLVPNLHGLKVPGVGSLDVRNVGNLYSGAVEKQALTVYAIEFGLPITFDLVPPETALGDFETFDVKYDISPFESATEHGKWQQQNTSTSKPDAQDVVQIPQP